ncbi:MocR-like pyridoxine biosynthesis transcription factor PdxR [Metapseudomonas furukawaii]|uniref:Transcriptional regulator n=1 Tax=Metapseudomonas furukawaii TaxID=1149133 RepID=A0AAD1C1L1_METFU|nr:PLP-dependent aminotransferase family protein [Pseudomonas furukawaii]ELS29380.1 Transcriptional regulator [Pseudomonas furukawaii]WAG77664.1 PLP-dependent aminotransferase family protein [Pseudomonas furukawaii]BAU75769.1 transcriptional regulator [Pseudomonas furukawaii]
MKTPGGMLLTGIELDRASPVPLYRQLYLQVRKQILSGRLPGGTRLPSTRTLCKELGLSRITLLNAFDQLTAEGFLASRTGAGSYVGHEWEGRRAATDEPRKPPRLSSMSHAVHSLRSDHFSGVSYSTWAPDCPTSFLPSHPAYDAFPVQAWKRLMNRHLRKPGKAELGYGELKGLLRLREAIVEYVADARGIECSVDQVVITSGAQQAFNLLGMLLLDPGDGVWMEDPGHIAARIAFQAQGCRLVPLPIDDQGLDVQQGVRDCPDARLAFTTPSRQHPLGTTMSYARRQELIDWGGRGQGWIIEDDCDSEFRYVGRPLPALYAMDPWGRVIYVGTFSKVLYPSLRLGYVILPEDLVEPFCAIRAVMDRSPSTLHQATVADFMLEGHFLGHIRRMRNLYQARQACLLEALQRHLGGFLSANPVESGLHLMGWLPDDQDDDQLARQLGEHQVYTYALRDYCVRHRLPPGLLLGFAATPEQQAERRVQELAQALTSLGLLT